MIRATVLVMLLFLPALVHSAPKTPEPEAEQVRQGQSSNPSETQQKTEPSTQIWPRAFQPSEEVGADAEISFPTDI